MLVGDLPSDIRDQLSQIVFDEALRLEALIESAVFYTTLQQGAPLQLEVEPLLGAALRQVEGAEDITPTFDDTAPRTISGDAGQLTRMFREVIANAVQCGSTSVDLQVAGDGEESIFTLRDNGEGIANDKLSVIFTPFYTTRDGRLGLGLPIARKIAEQHGGSIVVAPADNGGTIVTLSLPSARPLPH
jgi:signal transduction histidine kinase